MKKFSLAEAQALLPVVEVLLDRATRSAFEVARLEEKAAVLRVKIFHAGGLAVDVHAAFEAAAERKRQQDEAAEALAELESLGVLVKDLAAGILDFPTEWHGETILLCWKRGEARIAHWHGVDEAFDARQSTESLSSRGQKHAGPEGSERLH